METEKKVRVRYMKGDPKELTIYKLDVKKRNALFGKYLDLNKFMGAKNNKSSILNFIKEGQNVLEFMTEALEKAMPDLDLNKCDGSTADKLFEEHVAFILGLSETKN